MKLIDEREREVDVPDNPVRIISLSPAITEILFSLGLGDRIIGVTPFCVRPDEARRKRKVASYGYADINLFKEISPDLILTVTGYQNTVADTLSTLFPTFSFRLPSSLGGLLDLVVKVGIVTNRVEEARVIESDLIRAVTNLTRRPERSVYIEIDLGGPVTFGNLSYINDALRFMNLKSIYDFKTSEWLVPDFDFVRRSNPDVIILEPKMFAKIKENYIGDLVSSRKWEDINAVKNNSVHITPGPYDFFAHHGPSFIREVLPWLQKI
jgi:iron complex transport system substrate-binding protein